MKELKNKITKLVSTYDLKRVAVTTLTSSLVAALVGEAIKLAKTAMCKK